MMPMLRRTAAGSRIRSNPLTVTLPAVGYGRRWALELATADPAAEPGEAVHAARSIVPVESRALTILRRIA